MLKHEKSEIMINLFFVFYISFGNFLFEGDNEIVMCRRNLNAEITIQV